MPAATLIGHVDALAEEAAHTEAEIGGGSTVLVHVHHVGV